MIKMKKIKTSYFAMRVIMRPLVAGSVACVLLALLSSCAGVRRSGAGGEVTGVGVLRLPNRLHMVWFSLTGVL